MGTIAGAARRIHGGQGLATVLLLTALAAGCNGLVPTELACSETALCPPGYCCSETTNFCAPEGDPTCGLAMDAGSIDGGTPEDAGPGLDAGPGEDGGVDAGTDAGLHDAGEDAGHDAGQPDAGEDAGIDAGLDAGSGEDAGVDAGTPDAGPREDAGSDAGPMEPDAGQGSDAGADAGPDAGPTIVAPSDLTYAANPAVFTKGTQITSDAPTSSGSPVVSYAISPPLPTGLSLSTTTGILSGTPAVLSAATPYTVTATNMAGSTHVTLNITVNDVPPAALAYTANPAVYTAGQLITNDTPSHTGGAVTSYTISPALPAGLSFSTTTGIVFGTPTALSAATGYLVTASNSGGSTQVQLDITVNAAVPPANLAYTLNPAIYLKGVAIANNSPSSSGGAVASYAVSPTLPVGLSLNAVTGILSGTPAALMTETAYTVTATNSGGSTQVTLNLTVNDVPPRGLAYEVDPATYNEGQQITPNAPSYSGGTVTMFTITPDLPDGLSLDMVSGIISGTPTVMSGATDYMVTATNSGGSAQADLNITITNVIAPAGLTYSANPAVFTEGQLITSDVPSSTGGAPSSYGISSPLSPGLSFNPTTGVISGTPTALLPATTYTVGAYNATGSTSATLTITVNDVPPSGLTYSLNPAVYTLGQPIVANTPSTAGGGPVVSYSISPALPTGLSLSTTTGNIAGTPTVLSPATVYTVTATNTGGSITVLLSLAVDAVIPSGLTYSSNPAVYTNGHAITSNTPSSSGGAVVSWSISPALPTGLSFSTSTGVVSGTPTVLATQQGHLVTATNTGGSATVTLTITVNDVAPATLSYSTNPAVYTKGQAIANDAPTSSGGPVVSYSIGTTPPAGLMFSTTTGILSGTPTAVTAQAAYLVTATNTGGSTTATLTVTVNDVAPSGLSYATNPIVATKGTAITSDALTVSGGGPVISYAISPALPTGLSFSTTTGAISGTPSVLATVAAHTVTATNSGGSATVSVNVTVNDVPPSGLTYSVNPAIYNQFKTITNDTPSTSGGGPVISYGISPALPAGLSVSTTTGVISGTPTVESSATGYTITATNSGGSTTGTLTLTVGASVPPAGLTYTTNPAVYTEDEPIANNSPSSSGGPVASYSVSPALPAGLSFSTATGVISGTATVSAMATGYLITATNSGGSTTVTLTLTVNPAVIPTGLQYSSNPVIYQQGVAITPNTPSSSGGVVSYSISPALPAGLSFNTTTGVITGTPTAATAGASYTVQATNPAGSATVTIVMAVSNITCEDFCAGADASLVCAPSGFCVPPLYTDNGNGTVTDELSGLVWQQVALDPGVPWSSTGAPGSAQAYCANLSLAGGGWTLPTRPQLASLQLFSQVHPPIDTTYFPNAVAQETWTSSVDSSNGDVWFVNFINGGVSELSSSSLADPLDVRCVR